MWLLNRTSGQAFTLSCMLETQNKIPTVIWKENLPHVWKLRGLCPAKRVIGADKHEADVL